MVKNYKQGFFAFLLFMLHVSLIAQIPNAGFENWHAAGFPSYNEPDNWGTLNSSTAIISIFTAEKANQANSHSGNSAMKLSTHYISFASQTAPGIIASSGTINTSTQNVTGGFPFTSRSPALKGWYKGTPAANDSSQIELTIWKWDNINHVRIQLAAEKFTTSTAVPSYTEFTLPINYTLPNTPDSALILISSSNTDNPVDGSVFYVDDLAFVDCSSFTATTSSTNTTCTSSSGSASITIAGATSYNWSNSGTGSIINGLAAGTYNVTATDINGCSATAAVNVGTTNTTLTSTVSSTPSACGAGTGTATVTPTNGTAGYTYLWNNGGSTATISSIVAGNYQVTITDANGCSGTATTGVTTPNGPSATQVTSNVTCNGAANGSVDVSTTGGTGTITYQWSPAGTTEDISGLSAGNYSLTITDANNCSFVVTTTVTEPVVLSVSLTATDATTSTALDGAVSSLVSGGTTGYSYAWSNSSSLADLNAVGSGSYCVTVTDNNLCTVSACAVVSAPSAIEHVSNADLNISPNPAHSQIRIETKNFSEGCSFSIYSMDGRLMSNRTILGENTLLDVSELPIGLYAYQFRNISTGDICYGKLEIIR